MTIINRSCLVRASDFGQPWFIDRANELGEEIKLHRKLWEFCVITQAYHERIGNGGKVLGFGVGKEPLASWFASRGAEVIATDLPGNDADWDNTNQHATSLNDLHYQHICDKQSFDKLVTFRPVNMNDIPQDLLQGEFDFTWSCGSFEHIGGLEPGINFYLNQLLCLKAGGFSAHTTEYNYSSNYGTINAHNLCLYRKQDLDKLINKVMLSGLGSVLPLDLSRGSEEADMFVDQAPYNKTPYHLNLSLGGYEFTSILLVTEVKGSL